MDESKAIVNAQGQRGVPFKMRFIEPGVVRYEELGTVLVQKQALDKLAGSFIGKPVFDKRHQDTTKKDFSSGRADGIVSQVWYDPNDAWYWLEALIWDEETLEDIKNGYSLSCAYDVDKWSEEKGSWHNVPYVNEVLDGKYTHLAIVPNARYERALIIMNQGGCMSKMKFWPFKKDVKPEDVQASEVELANAVVEVEAGKEVKLDDIIAGYKAEEKRKADEIANSAGKLRLEEFVEIDGKKVQLKDAVDAYRANLKNSQDNGMSTDHKDGKHKDKTMESCGLCNAELANAAAAKAKEKAAEELKNATEEAEKERVRLETLRNARGKGQEPKMPEAPADGSARIQAGMDRYGPIPASTASN